MAWGGGDNDSCLPHKTYEVNGPLQYTLCLSHSHEMCLKTSLACTQYEPYDCG